MMPGHRGPASITSSARTRKVASLLRGNALRPQKGFSGSRAGDGFGVYAGMAVGHDVGLTSPNRGVRCELELDPLDALGTAAFAHEEPPVGLPGIARLEVGCEERDPFVDRTHQRTLVTVRHAACPP